MGCGGQTEFRQESAAQRVPRPHRGAPSRARLCLDPHTLGRKPPKSDEQRAAESAAGRQPRGLTKCRGPCPRSPATSDNLVIQAVSVDYSEGLASVVEID